MIELTRPQSARWILPVGIAGALLFGWLIGQFGMLGVALVSATLLGVLVFMKPEVAVIASIGTIIIGQLIRVPILGSNSVILNDVLLPVLIVVWGFRQFGDRNIELPRSSLTLPILIFLGIMILSILWNVGSYSSRELLSGSLYIVRWIEYALLLTIGFHVLRTQLRAQRYLWMMIWTGIIVSILGFFQLRIFPDFSFMVPQGWDPHVGRLLSTWFDPNFLAGYLALLVTIALAIALSQPFLKAKWWWLAIAIMSVAIVFTFSRSGYVALAVGAGLVLLVRSRMLLLLGIIAAISLILFVPRVNERVAGIRTIDETAQLRLLSWSNAWEVISDHLWTGVGYNLYSQAQVDYGFLDNPDEHAASGSDSSILTVWATTGTLGLIAFLWLYLALLREAWKTWRDKHLPRIWQGFGLGLLAGLLGLFLHSQFVNSLLYPHIMQVIWLFTAMAIMIRVTHARA